MSAKRIVVVDDSRVVLSVVTDILEAAGHNAVATQSGIEANTYIYGQHPPDLILLDVEMPLLNGDKKASIYKADLHLKKTPIILMSHKTDAEMEELCQSSGADGYILKPFEKDALLELLRKYC